MKRFFRTLLAAAAAAMLLPVPADVSADAGTAENKPHETHDTLLCVASVSKVFTTAAVMQLADAGMIDIDAPVADYLPSFRMADSRFRDITVRMLMNHTSGLMGSCYSNDMLCGDRDRAPHDNLLRHLSGERLKAAPGAYGAYCNDGFAVLEQIVEQVSGEDFTDYLEQHICKPLGLQQTGTPWNAFETDDAVRLYQQTQSSRTVFASNPGSKGTVPGEYCLTIGEGGILSTAPELCQFGTAFFTGNTVLLSDQAKKEMTRCYANDQYEDGFGLGWDTVNEEDCQAAGVQVVSKGGDLQHQHAELLVAPDEQISISVLTAGASSSEAKAMAKSLMNIALEDKGIRVEPVRPETVETVDSVPDSFLKYAGMYLDGDGIWALSFPEQKYMELSCITEDKPNRKQYMYTTDGRFVKMYGNIRSGKAVQDSEQQLIRFAEKNGSIYLCTDAYTGDANSGYTHLAGYSMQKLEPNPVSDDVQQVWEQRDRKKYYLYNEKYSSTSYTEMPAVTLRVPTEAEGYVNSNRITDADHAEAALHVPSSVSRDLSDIEMHTENDAEFLEMTALGYTMISEDAIPDLPAGLREVKLTTGAAKWYNMKNAAGKMIGLDIPEHAAVYVYNEKDELVYSSMVRGYGSNVPLPARGKIVFAGETGGVVKIMQ